MPELAFALPAAGAIALSVLRGHRPAALGAGAILGLAGLVAIILARVGGQPVSGALTAPIAAPARAVLIFTCFSGGLAVLLVPRGADRVPVLGSVLAGLAALAAVMLLAEPLLIALALIVLASLQAALPGYASFATRSRAPIYGALLLIFATLAGAGLAGVTLGRLAGVALVLGMTAIIGVAPYVRSLDPREPIAVSPMAWLGFVGPGLAVVLVTRLAATLPAEAAAGYSAVLLALGAFNLAVAAIGARFAVSPADLWRHSLLADWGLILIGLGLVNVTAAAGAYLLMVGILVFRLPLYAVARPALIASEPVARPGLLGIVLAAALAGGAPFAGFPARLLLLRGASQSAWPVALLLLAGMLAWLPLSFNLARTFGQLSRRTLGVLAILLLINAAIGLYPGPVIGLFTQP